MSDIPVYMTVNLAVTDADEYRKYEKGSFGLLKRYGGEFFTRRAGTRLEFLTLVHGMPPRA